MSEAHDRKEKAVARAQLTKSGFVYVLSNVGTFGEGIVKIGMTRRMEPMDRVKELSGASVSFQFALRNGKSLPFRGEKQRSGHPCRQLHENRIEDLIKSSKAMRIRQHPAGTLNEWSVRRQFIRTSVNEGLKILLGGFKVKLKPQDSVAIDKGLVLTGLTSRQMKSPLGQVEGFPMPMKNLDLRRNESPKFMTRRLFRKLDWKPADLWLGVLVNLGAQNVCDELASETNPQDGLPGFDGLTDEVLFRLEP